MLKNKFKIHQDNPKKSRIKKSDAVFLLKITVWVCLATALLVIAVAFHFPNMTCKAHYLAGIAKFVVIP